jgi:Tol biopolymer transport system component
VFANRRGIYSVDVGGGVPSPIRAPERRKFPGHTDPGHTRRTHLFNPALSPDGTQIAYIDGMTEYGNTLRVMNTHGTDVRVLIKVANCWLPSQPAWSPDGTYLLFACPDGLRIVRADGSGLSHIVRRHVENLWPPDWSPDGKRVAFLVYTAPQRFQLAIADADGSNIRTFGRDVFSDSVAGAWNPLPESAFTRAEPSMVGVSPLVLVIALLGVAGTVVLLRQVQTKRKQRRMSVLDGSDILPYAADETDGDHAAPSSVVVYVCGFG